jgi:hypothetical protein
MAPLFPLGLVVALAGHRSLVAHDGSTRPHLSKVVAGPAHGLPSWLLYTVRPCAASAGIAEGSAKPPRHCVARLPTRLQSSHYRVVFLGNTHLCLSALPGSFARHRSPSP